MSCNAQILRTPGGSRSDEENMAAVLAALTDALNRGGAFAGGHRPCSCQRLETNLASSKHPLLIRLKAFQ